METVLGCRVISIDAIVEKSLPHVCVIPSDKLLGKSLDPVRCGEYGYTICDGRLYIWMSKYHKIDDWDKHIECVLKYY